MERINLQKLPEDLTVRVLKAWSTIAEEFTKKGFLKGMYGTGISGYLKSLVDAPKRYSLKKSVYRLYNLDNREKTQVKSLMRIYGAEKYEVYMAD